MKIRNSYLILIFAGFLFSCKPTNPFPVIEVTEEKTIAYFKEIALGFEFGGSSEITRKWKIEMKILIEGNPTNQLSKELDRVVSELNELATDGFHISLTNNENEANFKVFLGSGDEYAIKYPAEAQYVNSNFGLFNILWNTQNELIGGHMYVDIYRTDIIHQKHLLREELTQSLGLGKDSDLYPDSIFQQSWTGTNEYSEIDKKIIYLLYHPDMKVGLNSETVEPVLRKILSENNLAI